MLGQKTIILLVEDDDGHAILITENLREAGITNPIQRFADGVAVLEYLALRPIEAHPHYLMLLDIRMPKMDGIEVLRRLKSDPALVPLPVIMLTTTDDMRDVERCYKLGCSVYLQKPIDYDKFVEAIRRLGSFVTTVSVPAIAQR